MGSTSLPKTPDLGVSFNGTWPTFKAKKTDKLLFPTGRLTHHIPEHLAFNYRLPVSEIREGWNEVLVFNGCRKDGKEKDQCASTVKVMSVALGVVPGKKVKKYR